MPPIPSLLIGRERDSVINLNNFRIGDSMSVALRTGLEQIGAQGVSTITHIPSGLPALAVAELTLDLASPRCASALSVTRRLPGPGDASGAAAGEPILHGHAGHGRL